MPLAPIPWLITDLTPEVIKALDGSIQTGLGRDGGRVTAPATPIAPTAPEFTVSKTDTTITAIISNANGAESYEVSIDGVTWVAGVTVAGLTPETPYSFRGRGINAIGTGPSSGVVTVTTNAAYSQVGVVFSDNFDGQPDYISRDLLSGSDHTLIARNGDSVPVGWDAVSDWSMYSEPHLSILASNSDKARGGTGKSLLLRRRSYGSQTWGGDCQLDKNLGQPGLKEVYVSFWIRFQPGWLHSGSTKMFRITSHSPEEEYSPDGNAYWGSTRMGFLWQHTHYPVTASGLRNYLQVSPTMNNPPLLTKTPGMSSAGDVNMGFTSEPTNSTLINQLTGQPLPASGSTSHEQVFGDAWHKMEFHLKVNSAPGVQDGIFTQWLDDTLMAHSNTVPWMQNGETRPERGFTSVRFGGNASFQPFPSEDQYQEWYSIDDVLIRDSLPLERL